MRVEFARSFIVSLPTSFTFSHLLKFEVIYRIGRVKILFENALLIV